ncbi:type II toxin-antitoxin system Phd/YefM family antitoxin [Ruegeria sediminis]|uniref:Antitoxin n=1 Tax=Ruegeria sediminis TaxID=2583820 RepID=A0ABY2X467_9RHOB|nr:type II toxin-antitoxin system Phd/YefM family antitoxin [Ruegeria sediminis]TMV09745.1 type II toxin-antitoxin system Phd/YefM family antitoxin [Ruegeria sediminis]
MRYTISQARAQLGQLVTRAQDPREVIVLTRNGRALAALVSIAEAERIWDLESDETIGWKHPLSGIRGWWSKGRNIPGMEPGPDGRYVTAREAALRVREVQMTRAEERRILARRGLEPVEGGEVMQRDEIAWWRRLTGRVSRA